MIGIILALGFFICCAGLVILVSPRMVFDLLNEHRGKISLHISAIVMRVITGLLLITQSGASRFPATIEIIGWLILIAAFGLAVMGRRNFGKLMSWALSLVSKFGRIAGPIATAFGVFLIYSFI